MPDTTQWALLLIATSVICGVLLTFSAMSATISRRMLALDDAAEAKRRAKARPGTPVPPPVRVGPKSRRQMAREAQSRRIAAGRDKAALDDYRKGRIERLQRIDQQAKVTGGLRFAAILVALLGAFVASLRLLPGWWGLAAILAVVALAVVAYRRQVSPGPASAMRRLDEPDDDTDEVGADDAS